jgi:hypothetical protein
MKTIIDLMKKLKLKFYAFNKEVKTTNDLIIEEIQEIDGSTEYILTSLTEKGKFVVNYFKRETITRANIKMLDDPFRSIVIKKDQLDFMYKLINSASQFTCWETTGFQFELK